jgi:hypothetical protein
MIIIRKDELNTFDLRLNDNVTINNPKFLFEFECVQSNEKFYVSPDDSSPSSRYNRFQIYSTTGSPTGSTPAILFNYGGQYLYTVYQMSDYGLTPSNVILDSGKAMFYNGEYDEFFFFGLDDTIDYVFDDYVNNYSFESESIINYVFDPEFIRRLLTQDYEPVLTEDNINLLY